MRMQITCLALAIVVLGTADADARRRHHRHHAIAEQPYSERELSSARASATGSTQRGRRGGEDDVTDWLPRGWQLQPTDPNWKGRRYVSPDGFAKVSIFKSQAGEQPVSAQMKEIAFMPGEQLSYLRGERDWIVASGVRDGRVFYRKASLACGGKNWHQIEF